MLQEVFTHREVTEEVSQELAELKEAGKRLNTDRARRADWDDFSEWCEEKGVSALPTSIATLDRYLADRATNSRAVRIKGRGGSEKVRILPPAKVSTLKRRLDTIRSTHRKEGFELDTSHPSIRETMRGIAATRGSDTAQKAALLVDDIRHAVRAIPLESEGKPLVKGYRDRALLLLGFMGCFRGSELLGLRTADVERVELGLEVTVRLGKTDKNNAGHTKVIPFGSHPEICPVRIFNTWLELAQVVDSFAFRATDRHGNIKNTPLSLNSLSRVIKENPYIRSLAEQKADRATRVGNNSEEREALVSKYLKEFASHSLRRGFITSAYQAGADAKSTMAQSGHARYETYAGYIESGDSWVQNAASTLKL